MKNEFIIDETAAQGQSLARRNAHKPSPIPKLSPEAPRSETAFSRRDFLGNAAKSAGVACLATAAIDQYIRTARATDATRVLLSRTIDCFSSQPALLESEGVI